MPHISLTELALLLAAMAVAAPLARALGIGSVLGYLIAGVALGPHGIQTVFSSRDAHEFLEFAEFGIVLLLFVIGLELRPKRIWAMRTALFSLGGQQVFLSALLIGCVSLYAGFAFQTALFIGFALALSSTAFALQVLEETGELTTRHGRMAFAVLLFQDLAAIPLMALVPLFAVSTAGVAATMDLGAAAMALGVIAGVIIVGHYCLDYLIQLVALTKVKEAMTAAALLTVVTVALVMQLAGLSAALGAFIAGALLSESSYRHQLEADIQPFQGLLLGLFFTAIGMSLNVNLVFDQPGLVLGLAAGLVLLKTLVLFGLGRWHGLTARPARRLGLSLSQGGEFAFVLIAAGLAVNVLSLQASEVLLVVVTLSMTLTPILLAIEALTRRFDKASEQRFDELPSHDEHVVIAGFGRYGQIVARVLRAKKIPFTALDSSADQIAFVKGFGAEAFFGDASRPEILEAARTGQARAFVLAIDDVEASLRTAEVVRNLYPDLKIYARARNRAHAHRLIDLGITQIQRETFQSALETTREVLAGLGYPKRTRERLIETFVTHDERRLKEDYAHFSDQQKLQARARSDAATLEQLFAEDEAEAVENASGGGSDGRVS